VLQDQLIIFIATAQNVYIGLEGDEHNYNA